MSGDLLAALRDAGVNDDQAAALAGALDAAKFLDATGAIDRGKLANFLDGIPSGARTGSKGDSGRREAERRFGKPATTEPDTDTSPGAAGLAEAKRRFGTPTTAA